ncbi:hypothetical protein M3182_22050 [Mesobacillus maritimus]|uniref:WD40/YVTN/BNR-like repeat-containing protein n=1 Tax=Mesobacillus maritimus TaxID=1643336 RepID=UPI00203B19DA|nr:hypothetical protein [Mesobacillus maritimus]MCM3588366.1 hypothetical protein [Mesobacillus maritimus]
MKKKKVGIVIILLCMVILLVVKMINEEKANPIPEPVEVNKTDINSKLPYPLQVEEYDQKPETIAYRILFDLMKSLESEGSIDGANYTRFTKLSGNENSFTVAVVFNVQLPEETPEIDYGWGEMEDHRAVPSIVWKLTINKGENRTYTLTKIEKTNDTQIGLPPVESLEDYQKNAGIDASLEIVDYEIDNHQLKVTYDNGQNWESVPVAVEDLVLDHAQQLQQGTFVIGPDRTAFVLNKGLSVLISTDKGESWNEVLVSNQLPAIRLQILGFTSEQDGYLIVTGDKTMSSEANFIFKTNDGGQSWYNAGSVNNYDLVTDGGFIDDQLGFVSYGEYRYESELPVPNLYRTADGGGNWERIEVPIPEEYLGYFTTAEIPTFQGTGGTLLINQGPQGDYFGGNVLAKFHSQDQGKTWSFAGLVDPDGVLLPK